MTSISIDRHDNLASSAFGRLAAALTSTDRSSLLTLLRVVLGIVILPHGLQKTAGWFGGYGYSATMDYFGSIGIPSALAFLAIAAESAGALALIAGLGTRVAAFGIGVTLTVAAFMHRANGFFMNWSGAQKGEGVEFHILVVAIATVLVIGGAGRFSADRAIAKKL
jgi:putative oxidoreductase